MDYASRAHRFVFDAISNFTIIIACRRPGDRCKLLTEDISLELSKTKYLFDTSDWVWPASLSASACKDCCHNDFLPQVIYYRFSNIDDIHILSSDAQHVHSDQCIWIWDSTITQTAKHIIVCLTIFHLFQHHEACNSYNNVIYL